LPAAVLDEVVPPTKLIRSNLAWLVRLRWLAIASQLVVIVVARFALELPVAPGPLLGVVGVAAASNVAVSLWVRRASHVAEAHVAASMALDFAQLTALLALAGGSSNPFSVLYLVHVALAAVVLKPRRAALLAALAAASFGSLFLVPSDAGTHAMHMHHGGASDLHFQGMWVAFAIAALAIVYFVTRVTRDLDEERAAAAEARTRALRSEKLASLATLAAGAAHELATPLSTIAVVAKELERALGERSEAADARLIREEVERCREVLAQLGSDAGESRGEAFSRVSADQLVAHMLSGLAAASRVRIAVASTATLELPAMSMARALRGLLKNALEAGPGEVRLRVEASERELSLCVEDQGCGMAHEALARLGEPFFTSKEPGHGMGLGVFLARAVVEQLGGTVRFESELGRGTRAHVGLPRYRAAR
jgi:two-component system sensor histidine kinase RegB